MVFYSTRKKRKKHYKISFTAKLKRKLDKLCSLVIKTRDNHTCQWCGKKVSGQNEHWSHIYSRSNLFVRWDLLNSLVLCFACHRRFHGGEGLVWFKKVFPHRYNYLHESLVSPFSGQPLPRHKYILRNVEKLPFMKAKLKELQDKLKELTNGR